MSASSDTQGGWCALESSGDIFWALLAVKLEEFCGVFIGPREEPRRPTNGNCEHPELLAGVPAAGGAVPSHPFSVFVKIDGLHCGYGFFTPEEPCDPRYVEVKMIYMDINGIFVGHGTYVAACFAEYSP